LFRQIGVAQGTFYYYCKSKEEVTDAVIDRHLAHMLEPFKELATNDKWTAFEEMKIIIKMIISIIGFYIRSRCSQR